MIYGFRAEASPILEEHIKEVNMRFSEPNFILNPFVDSGIFKLSNDLYIVRMKSIYPINFPKWLMFWFLGLSLRKKEYHKKIFYVGAKNLLEFFWSSNVAI